MIGNSDIQPTIGVKDMAEATRFYGSVLGLEVVRENQHEVIYKTGDTKLSVYATPSAGTNQATYATWEVDDIDSEVQELASKGVTFEHYDDMEGVTREGEIHLMGDEKASWFKDPDGNILCLHADA